MDDLKKMSDKELSIRMVMYIERVQKLMDSVSEIMDGKGTKMLINSIHHEYKAIKQAVKDDAHYLNLTMNRRIDEGSELYNGFFKPSISEAATFGFASSTNSRIDFKFYDSLEEARYKLTKFYTLEEWKEVAGI